MKVGEYPAECVVKDSKGLRKSLKLDGKVNNVKIGTKVEQNN